MQIIFIQVTFGHIYSVMTNNRILNSEKNDKWMFGIVS